MPLPTAAQQLHKATCNSVHPPMMALGCLAALLLLPPPFPSWKGPWWCCWGGCTPIDWISCCTACWVPCVAYG